MNAMKTATRCRRCDVATLRPTLCERCTRLGDEVILAVQSGVRRFWRFEPQDSDEPQEFGIEVLDEDHVVADFAHGRAYRVAWLRFAAFVSREAALRYRLDRIERDEQREIERLAEERLRVEHAVHDAEAWLDEALREAAALDESFAHEQRSLWARRIALVNRLREDASRAKRGARNSMQV